LFFMYRTGSDKSNVTWFDKNLKFCFKCGDHEFFTKR